MEGAPCSIIDRAATRSRHLTRARQAMTQDRHDNLTPGTLVAGRYRITEFIGSGGFGAVYEAIHLAIDAPVALKILFSDDNPQSRDRFLQEARAAARIDHPNVISVHDYGATDDGRPFFAMERLQGHNLAVELQQRGHLDPERALRLLCGALDALAEAHKHGIVHKDLKPSNLFLHHPGQRREALKILDFGIARIHNTQLTQSGQTIGTAQYLVPEYIEHQTVSPALDVYQMGLILIEMLCGLPAVRDNSWWGAVSAHLRGDLTIPEPLRQRRIGQIISQATHRDPRNRFQSALTFQNALESLDTAALRAQLDQPAGRPPPIALHDHRLPPLAALTEPLPPPPIGFTLVLPGSFLMGSPPDELGRVADEPRRRVTLTRPFVAQQVPVTQLQWELLLGNNPSYYAGPDRPVDQVSWFDALAFCNALSASEGLPQCYAFEEPEGAPGAGFSCRAVRFMGPDCPGYRLPTEAEWEYMARATSSTAFWSGPCLDTTEDPGLSQVAWYRANSGGRTRPVGCKPPNSLDLFDVLGNIAEWTQDIYAPYPNDDSTDPLLDGPLGGRRVFRGGSWHCLARDCRAARRGSTPAATLNRSIGLRPVRTWRQGPTGAPS